VLGLLKEMDLKVCLRGLPAEEISCIQEAFITSASRGVLPVTTIDNIVVGDGNPGLLTRAIMEKFEQEIVQRMVEI
jgi:branched-subunit amino acid aminotransferase/4-amino-4-deoxychorismate lyase